MRQALDEWDQLRSYAAKVAQIAAETADDNRTLSAQNDAMRGEIERLTGVVAQLTRENRVISAFGEHLRARLKVISESIEIAERESLEYANHRVTVSPAESKPERAEASAMAENIARLGLPVNQWK